MTRDPIGYGDGLNVYLYVHNNPINHVDPLGLETDDEPFSADLTLEGPPVDLTPEPREERPPEQKKTYEQSYWEYAYKQAVKQKAEQEAWEQEQEMRKAAGLTGLSGFFYDAPLTGPLIRGDKLGFAADAFFFYYGIKMWRGMMAGMPTNSGTSCEGASYRFTNELQPIGKVEIPAGVVPGTTTFGNIVHKGFPEVFAEQYGGVKFTPRTASGQTGVDISVAPRYVEKVGFAHAELKPNTASGFKSYRLQLQRWEAKHGIRPTDVQPFTYDSEGNIYRGFQF